MQHVEAVRGARLADIAPSRGRYTPEASLRTRGPRPRRFLARALITGAFAAASALPALTSAVEPSHAEAPLETPGVTTTSFNRAEGRIGATVINNTEGDRTTFVSDNGYFGVVRGQSRYNSSDPNQSSIKHTSGTQVQPWLRVGTTGRTLPVARPMITSVTAGTIGVSMIPAGSLPPRRAPWATSPTIRER